MVSSVLEPVTAINPAARTLLRASVRRTTRTAYESAFRRFRTYCDEIGCPDEVLVYSQTRLINFIGWLSARSPSLAPGTIRNAVAAVAFHWRMQRPDLVLASSHRLVQDTLSGVDNILARPPTERFAWDTGPVLQYWSAVNHDDLLLLTQKALLLLALATAWRPRSDIGRILWLGTHFEFANHDDVFPAAVSLTAWRTKEAERKQVSLRSFSDETICPVRTIWLYVERIRLLRQFTTATSRLFVLPRAPYTDASEDSIGRWLQQALAAAGVDASAHSTRAVAASTALSRGVPLDHILRSANWASARTFGDHYSRHVLRGHSQRADATSVSVAVLNTAAGAPHNS